MALPSTAQLSRLLTVICLLCSGILLGCQEGDSAGGSANGTPSILLISVDGLVHSELSAFGGEISTPTLEKLVAEGRGWPQAQTVAPMTRPAVASLLSGLAPDIHGVRDDLFTRLDERFPTVAERLSAQGYRTAAFPDSAFLVEGSGLWRGFELVNDPPPVRIDPVRWFPRVLAATDLSGAFTDWAQSTQPGDRWFSWVHLSFPLVGQMKQVVVLDGAEEGAEKARVEYTEMVQQWDQQLAAILGALEASGRNEQTAIILVGTQGDQRGGEQDPPGLGYSLADRAVMVPIVAALPAGFEIARSAEATPTSLDVPATILELAGVEAEPAEEGISLTRAEPTDRVRLSWSWAQHDQLGWEPLIRADRGGGSTIHGTGISDTDESLSAIIEGRERPSRLEVPMEQLQPFLDEFGIETTPIAAQGVALHDPVERRELSHLVWRGRGQYQARNVQQAGIILASVSRKRDKSNLTAFLDRGQALALSGLARSKDLMERAVQLRPQDPDVWHWYAHSIWTEDWTVSERILEVVEPYVTNKGDILYDLACTRSLAEDLDRSAELLEAAWNAGYRDANHMETDADLRNLRESGKFSEVMRRLQ